MQRRKLQPAAPRQRARLTRRSATPAAPDFNDAEPWERQHRESDPAWQAFRLYRDMPHRSLREVARSIAGDQNRNETTTFRLVAEWSRRWNWPSRCCLFDMHQDRALCAAMVRRQAHVLESAQRVLVHPIAVFAEMLRQEPQLTQHLADALLGELRRGRAGSALMVYERLMQLVVRTSETMARLIPVERLARGLSTNNTTVGRVDDDLFDGEVFRRSFPDLDSDPELAGLIRAVLVRARGDDDEDRGV